MCKITRAKIIRLAQAALITASSISTMSGIPAWATEPAVHSTHAMHANAIQVTEEKIGKHNYQVSRMHVNARPEHIWRVLTDYNNAVDIFPCLKKCTVLHDHGATKEVEQQIKPSGVPGSFTYVLEVTETPNRMQKWRRLRGDFAEVEGFWKLDPAEDGTTLVTYASYVSGGFFLPQALIKRQARMDFPGVMSALKLQSETTRHIASRDQHSHKN